MPAIRTALFVLGIGLVVGCSGGGGSGEVSGAVTYGGEPIEGGSITFIPADGNKPTAGAPITNGTYAAKNVPVGKAKVSISGVKSLGKKRMYDDPAAPLVQESAEMLPAKYHRETELTYDVAPGVQTKDFHLTK